MSRARSTRASAARARGLFKQLGKDDEDVVKQIKQRKRKKDDTDSEKDDDDGGDEDFDVSQVPEEPSDDDDVAGAKPAEGLTDPVGPPLLALTRRGAERL